MQEVARTPSVSTSSARAAWSCSTRCLMISSRDMPRRCGDSVNDLSRARRSAAHRPPDVGHRSIVRDHGLLESALSRPQASAFGQDAYRTLDQKAGALLHSVARNHALIDGNKRLALAATIAFLGINGQQLRFSNDDAYDFVIAVTKGDLDEVAEIAAVLSAHTAPRDQ